MTEWTVVPAAELPAHSDRWRRVCDAHAGANPLLDIRFACALFRHFGSDDVRLALARDGDRDIAAVLLERGRRGVWQTFSPGQAPLGLGVFAYDNADARFGAALADLSKVLAGTVSLIGIRNQDPKCSGEMPDSVAHVEAFPHVQTVSIQVDGDFDDYWQARSRQLRRKLRKLMKTTDEAGHDVALSVLRDRVDMARGVAEHGQLESAGWKGAERTAIHEDNVQGRFYTDVLEAFAETGDARVFQLRFSGELVASQLAIRSRGCLALLKTTYDEAKADYSPGRLLDYLMLQKIFLEKDAIEVEYYTNAKEEDLRWATGSRWIYHYNFYPYVAVKKVVFAVRALNDRFGNTEAPSAGT